MKIRIDQVDTLEDSLGHSTGCGPWIGILLVDEHGGRVAGEQYRLLPAAGSEIVASLDKKGVARYDELDPADAKTCRFTFTKLDRDAWYENDGEPTDTPIGEDDATRAHEVKRGECLTMIAAAAGFYWGTIWDAPQNAKLKEERGDPNTLLEDDVVHIPEPRENELELETRALHKFVKRGIPAELRIQLLEGDAPQVDVDYTIEVEGPKGTIKHEGKTDENGMIVVPIAPDAFRAALTVGPDGATEDVEVELGELPPTGTTAGIQARLRNLGHFQGDLTDEVDEATQEALRSFQAAHGLDTTGEADEATTDLLASIHDQVSVANEESDEEIPVAV